MTIHRRLRPILLLLAAVPAHSCGDPAGAGSGEGLRVLFVGNSLTYTNDLPGIVAALADSAGVEPLVVGEALGPGYSLEDHWLDGRVPRLLRDGGWDVVVAQQGPSSLPESRDHLVSWARTYAANLDGGLLGLYMVWPAESRLHAFDAVRDSYRAAAEAAGAGFYPAGEAWRTAWSLGVEERLFGPDGVHPSAAGSYLAALVVWQGLYGRSPVGLPATLELRGGSTLRLDPGLAATLQEAAALTTREWGFAAAAAIPP